MIELNYYFFGFIINENFHLQNEMANDLNTLLNVLEYFINFEKE